jgi:hypothetical protein
MSEDDRLAAFLGRYSPEVEALTGAVLERMRARLPGAVELVYDNYNALVVGFGPNERASDAPLSIAVYPRWIALCFLQGAKLSDPERRLAGTGKQVRNVRLGSPQDLDALDDLIEQAVRNAPAWDHERPRRIVIKSVSPRQRPRRSQSLKSPQAPEAR